MIKYEFPCYPGDDVWYIDSVGSKYWCRPDKVEMVGFTTRSIRIKLRGHKDFGKTYTWGKNVFKTEHEALLMIAKLCGTLEEGMTNEERYNELYQLLLEKSGTANVEPVFRLDTGEEINPDPRAIEVINQILEKAYLPFLCRVITEAGYKREETKDEIL